MGERQAPSEYFPNGAPPIPVRTALASPGRAAANRDNVYWAAGTTALIVLFAVVAVRVHELFPFIFRPLKPVVTVAIPLTILMVSRTAQRVVMDALRDRQMRLLLAYVAFIFLTVPFALWPGKAFSTGRGLFPALLLVLGCFLVRPNRATLDRVQLGFIAAVLFFASYAQIFGRTWAGRLRGVSGSYDTNDMAALMALAFPLAAGVLLRSQRGRPRLLAGLAVIALVLGVIATGSRGGTLALMAGALVFALPMRGTRGLMVWLMLIGGGAIAWSRATPEFRGRMMSLTRLEEDYNYTHDTGRKAVWARGRSYWRANPIIGVGAGNFPEAEAGFNAATGRTGKWSAAHNAYIQALAELGTVGGGIFILMLLTGAKSALPLWWQRRPKSRGPPRLYRPDLLASLAACATGAYFLSHAYFPPLFGVLGLIALAERTAKAEVAPDAAALTFQPAAVRSMRRPGERGGLSFGGMLPPTAARGGLR